MERKEDGFTIEWTNNGEEEPELLSVLGAPPEHFKHWKDPMERAGGKVKRVYRPDG